MTNEVQGDIKAVVKDKDGKVIEEGKGFVYIEDNKTLFFKFNNSSTVLKVKECESFEVAVTLMEAFNVAVGFGQTVEFPEEYLNKNSKPSN